MEKKTSRKIGSEKIRPSRGDPVPGVFKNVPVFVDGVATACATGPSRNVSPMTCRNWRCGAGTRVEVTHARPLPQDDPVRRRPDITLAKQKLGWGPKVPIRDGLARTIAYFNVP
jgi:nucleoside-diphosphate-sugar epimerase